MKIFLLSIGRIYWGIKKNDPPLQNLKSLPNFFLINPLLYSEIKKNVETNNSETFIESEFEVSGFLNEVAILETKYILLGTELENIDDISVEFLKTKPFDYMDLIIEYIYNFLPNLRQSSKQVTINTDVTAIQLLTLSKLPDLIFPQPTEKSNLLESAIKKYWVDTKVTWQNISEADDNVIIQNNPVYEKLLLDAIHAYNVKDYRRALLYSAISLETLAAIKLDDEYELAIQNRNLKAQLRIVSFPQKKGKVVLKDPVYTMLRERARFLELLHEVALYILGKSLLLEDHTLYQKAEKIYKTRNKIAHLGELNNDVQGIFYMNDADTLQAIECTIDIFKWFGVNTDFPIPKFEFIKLDQI
ncbi:MAG: hypothetical protein EA343_10935 [Nodularia sp. (in: Bacteria)]|nr:MAG: hypothetical protein EA343_10935 [Nodularia sp. (in: cyanobacteria)]